MASLKQLGLARGEDPSKGGDYIIIIIINASGQDPHMLQDVPGPSLPYSHQKRPWGRARLLGHFSDLGGGLVSPWSHPRP